MFVVYRNCLWCIATWKESWTWNFGYTRVDYIISIQETVSLLLLILSPGIRQASQRGRSRMQRSKDLCTCSKLNYQPWKDFKWIIQSNQIKDCPVTVKHIDTALKIWGKNVMALKGKTTWTKPDLVARDFVKVPV